MANNIQLTHDHPLTLNSLNYQNVAMHIVYKIKTHTRVIVVVTEVNSATDRTIPITHQNH